MIEKTVELTATKELETGNAWQGNVDVTPPQSKRGFLPQSPVMRKYSKAKRIGGRNPNEGVVRKRPCRRSNIEVLQKTR